MSLAGRLAIVTGAGSGIGRATCGILAREGAEVIAADKNKSNVQDTIKLVQNNSQSTKHLGLELDVGNSKSIKDALHKTIELYRKPPSIIVNCAGITRDNFLLKMSEADFDEVLDVNLKGTFLVIQTFANSIVDHEIQNASVINIASIVGKIGNIGQCNYTASKSGVELLTKTAAKELGRYGIRVNAILPGFIKTPMIETVPDKVKAQFATLVSLKRFGEPSEIGEVIAFLASDKSSFVNGASIEVTGGM